MPYSNSPMWLYGETLSEFDEKMLAKDMTKHKDYFEEVKKTHEDCIQKGYGHKYQSGGGNTWGDDNSHQVSCWWQIADEVAGLSITYHFKDEACFDTFEKAKNDGIINKVFGVDYPALVVYDKERSRYELTFSTNPNILEIPTTQEFVDDKLNFLRLHEQKLYKKVKLFQQFENKQCPLFKKKKFLAGKKVLDDLYALSPVIIDNNKQDKIKSYSEITELIK